MVARMDALDERGYVERIRQTEDRRSYEIRLTTSGRELLAELRDEANRVAKRFFSPLTTKEHAQLHQLLAKLAASLDE